MKKYFKILALLVMLPAFGFGQIVKTAAVTYTKGSNPYTVNLAGSSEIRIDTATSVMYWWKRDALTWVRVPYGVDVITGSVAPAYIPRDNQSVFAINAIDSIYYYNGADWKHVNAGGGGSDGNGIYSGSGTIGAPFTTATIDSIMRFLGDEATDRFIAAVAGGSDVASVTVIDTAAYLYYDDAQGTNQIEANNEGISLTTNTNDRVTITGKDARYAADYSGSYSDRSLVDKGYVDGALSGEVSIPDGEIAFGNATSDGITSSSDLTFDGDVLTNQLITLEGSSGTITGKDGTFQDLGASSSTSGGTVTIGNYDGAAMSNTHRMGAIQWGANTGVGSTSIGASIQAFAAANWSGPSSPGELRFSTTPSGTLTEKERFRLTRSATAELRNATALSFYNSADNGAIEISVADSAAYIYGLGASSEGELVLQTKIGLHYAGTAALTGNTNNLWVGGGNIWQIGSNGAYNLTGVVGGMRNNRSRLVFVRNSSNFVITLKDESASSSAANRFDLDGSDYAWQPDEMLIWLYDNGPNRWYVLNQAGGSSGITQETNAPPTLYPPQITATQNDYSPTGYSTTISQTIQVDGDGSFRTITGLAAATRDGVEKTFDNDGTNCYIIAKQHTGSSAANRVNIPKDVIMFPGMSATFRYDSVGQRWKLKNTTKQNVFFNNYVDASLVPNTGSGTSGDSESWIYTTNGGTAGASAASGSTAALRQFIFSSSAATAFPNVATKSAFVFLDSGVSYLRIAGAVRVNTLSAAAEDYDVRIGFKASVDTTETEGFWLSYEYQENSGNFVLRTHDGSSPGTANSTTAMSGTVFKPFEVIYYPYGECTMFVDGERVSTTSNLPTDIAVTGFALFDRDSGSGSQTRQLVLRNLEVTVCNVAE